MTQSFNFEQNDQNKQFDVVFKDGSIELEQAINSIVKHTWFCEGRLTKAQRKFISVENSGGFIGDVMNNSISFSSAWFFYKQNVGIIATLLAIKDAVLSALLNNTEVLRLQKLGNNISVNVNKTTNVRNSITGITTIGINKINIIT